MAAADVTVAAAGLRRSKSPLLPQITFSENVTRGNDPVYVFGSELRQQVFQASDFGLNKLNRPTPLNNVSTSFSGRWTAFDSLHTQFQIKRASFLKQSASVSSDRTSQEVISDVISAYESVLIAAREVEVEKHAVETAQALYDLSRSRVDAGVAVDSDVLSAQVNLAMRQQELIQAQGTLRTAWVELEAAMGMMQPAGPDTLEQLNEHVFSTSAFADEVEQFKNRPDLKSLALQISAQQAAVRSAKSEFGPRVDAFGSWQTDQPTFSGAAGNNWTAGAEVRLDLLPYEKQAHLQQERAALMRAQAGEESARNLIRVEVSRAYFGHQSAAKLVEVAGARWPERRRAYAFCATATTPGWFPLLTYCAPKTQTGRVKAATGRLFITTH